MQDFFDFIDDLELEEISGTASGAKFGGVQKNPTDADLRLFSDGKIYPSKDLVNRLKLEYQKKDSNLPEYGFDIFSTEQWGQYQAAAERYLEKTGHTMPNMMVISRVSKHSPRVDVFGSTTYEADGSPKASVLTQGSSTFGKELIDILAETWGYDPFGNGEVFIDLQIEWDKALPSTKNGIYNVPKKVKKGKDAGKYSYVRREKAEFYPLTLYVHEKSGVGGQHYLTDQMKKQEEEEILNI
jgi:hypothetical protein